VIASWLSLSLGPFCVALEYYYYYYRGNNRDDLDNRSSPFFERCRGIIDQTGARKSLFKAY
jgi:hypothetical protein